MPRLVAVYLAAYAFLVIGAAMTVWGSGLIDHLHRGWTITVFGSALLLGLLLALLSRK